MKRFLAIGALGLALLAAALAWTFLPGEGPAKPQATAAAKPEPRLNVAAPPPLPAAGLQQKEPVAATAHATQPGFDVVRIKPTGDAVIAGRAAPGAEVAILDGGRELGKVVADARGEWVFLPPERLPPGTRELALSARNPDGAIAVSSAVVVLHVPEPGAKPEEATVAVAMPREGGASRVLQAPGAEQKPASPVTLDVVDYGEDGQLILSGRAAPGADVLVYLDDQPLGRARAGANGAWQLRADRGIDPGDYRLRADQVTPQGKVVARVETPFTHADLASRFPDPARGDQQLVVVQPGDSLWRISRFHFGRGVLYTVIYQANKGQIRDPDLIYPGQVFSVPSLN